MEKKQIKELLLKLLCPGILWMLLIVVLAIAALVFTFTTDRQETVIGYIAYVFSVYALVVLILGVIPAARSIKVKISSLADRNKYANLLYNDLFFRTKMTLYPSLVFNLLYAIFQLVAGILYSSFWYMAVAVYYIVVCGVRFLLLRHFRKPDKNPKRELKAYRFCGWLLFALNATMIGMVVQMVRDGEGARYPGLLIYVMATYAFYRITISIINVVKYRGLDSPVLSAYKALNFATALMAIFSLETAMLAEFGGDGDFEQIMNSATGAGVCLIIFCMAIVMICRANKELRILRINNS